jgi:hypothetical protein
MPPAVTVPVIIVTIMTTATILAMTTLTPPFMTVMIPSPILPTIIATANIPRVIINHNRSAFNDNRRTLDNHGTTVITI